MKNYSKIEEQIKNDIPRLMELRQGCFLTLKNSNTKFVINFINNGGWYCLQDLELNTTSMFSKEDVEKYFTILGQEITMNDLYEWLRLKDCGFQLRGISYRQDFKQGELNIYNNLYIDRNFIIDLSSNYLKDQVKELFEFLITLI